MVKITKGTSMKIEIEIKDLPIKCKDCKHYNQWSEKCKNDSCPVFGHEVPPYWYCYNFEQKDK